MKNCVYGWEKPNLEQLEKEILVYTDETCFDSFSNLIACRNGEKTVVVGVCVSENALLINEILPDGRVRYTPLSEPEKTLSNERVLSPGGRQGLLFLEENILDFCTGDPKATARMVKPGDAVYVKGFSEALGDSYITNQLPYFLTWVMTQFLKTSTAKLSVAFLREQKKGAHALGLSFPAEEAYFLTCLPDLKKEVCFLKKEGDFVSPMDIPSLETAVSKEMKTSANTYFLSSGCARVAGIAINCKKLPNGHYQIKKTAVKELFSFLESLC